MNNNMEILVYIFNLFIYAIMLSFALLYRKYKPLDGKQEKIFIKSYDIISKFIILVSGGGIIICVISIIEYFI